MTHTNATLTPPDRSRLYSLSAWAIWIGFILLLALFTGNRTAQGKNSVVKAYRDASLAWVHSQPIYELTTEQGLPSVQGFLYLPASAVLTVPLALLPQPAHEFAFRWLSILALAWSLHRVSRVLQPYFGQNIFLFLTLCVLAPAAGPARAGQMNLLLAALMTLAVADAIDTRWWRSALWLGLGFALKPQAIVLAALMIALCPKLRVRGILMVAAALALPFLFQSPGYVLDQYHLCVQKLAMSGRPAEAGVHDNDLSGVLGAIGLNTGENFRWTLRFAAALLTLWACWLTTRRRDPLYALLAMLALAATYLMLFNPRTEGGSYVIAAVPLAVFAGHELLHRRWLQAGLLITVAVVWGLSYEVSHGLWALAHAAGLFATAPAFREGFGPYWLSPTLALAFLAYFIRAMITGTGPRGIPRETPG